MSLHLDKRGSGNWLFTDNDTSSLGKSLINWTNGIIRSLDLDEEDWLLESWLSGKLASIEASSSSWDDLTSTSMDGIGMKDNIIDVISDTSHVLVTKDTLLGGPLESSFVRVLDFVEELDTLGGLDEHVWSVGVWSIAPNLLGISLLPLEILDEDLGFLLGLGLWSALSLLDQIREFIGKWESLHEKSVMLVWGLREAHLGGLLGNGLLVGDDRVSLLDLALCVLFFEILKADFDMELTATGNNVLTGLLSCADNEWIGLGKLLESLDELRKIGGVLDINGNSDNRGDGVFHDSDVVSILIGGDGSLLHEVLIDTNESASVTAWNFWDGFDLSSHHDDGSLDVLDVKIVLGSRDVVRSLNSNFLSGGNGTSENSTESVESSFIVGRDHLRDEDAKWSVLIAVIDRFVCWIINWTFIEISSSILLGLEWGWELEDDHFKKGLSSVDPLLENVLHEMFSLEISLGRLELDTEGNDHLVNLIHLTLHSGSAKSNDWLHHELDESSLELRSIIGGGVGLPLLGFLIEVVITPKLLLHL